MSIEIGPYPEYRESGEDWLGVVPAHWNMLRTKYLLREVDNRSVDGHETHLSMSQRLGLVPSEETSEHRLLSESYAGAKVCDIDDLVLNRLKAHLGVFAIAGQRGVVSPDYTVFRRVTPDIKMRYIEPLFKSNVFRGELRNRAKGVVEGFWRLYTDDFHTIRVPVPPLEEQSAIVRFLDHMDRRIRRYIKAKQRQIKLLEEQKQAIIHRAVTQGLDPNVRLKPSGVEWLGEVPEHWNVIALRLRYEQCLGKMLDSKRVHGENSLRYLRNYDVQWDQINTANLPVMDIPPYEHARYTVIDGDLLVCEGGYVGRCAIWKGDGEPCGFQKALHRLRPIQSERDVPRFLLHCMFLATNGGAFADGHESTIAHLTGEKLRMHRFPFPPYEEQKGIVKHIDHELAGIHSAIEHVKTQISLLREYRTRLISDVVTGKLDVRAVAAALPDDPEDDVFPIDDTPDDDASPEEDIDPSAEEDPEA